MSQTLGSLVSSPVNRRRALGFGAAACAIGAGYVALRYTSRTEGKNEEDSSDGLDEPKKLLRRLQRSVAGTRVPAARPSTTPADVTGEGSTGDGAGSLPSMSMISSSVAVMQSPAEPAAAAFSSWVKGPFMEFSQMPIAYVRASVVNGGSAMRIWAADQMIDAAMADAEILFARSFAGSANAYAAMASELMARRKAKAAASGKGRKGFSAGSEAPKQATVEESVAAGVEFVKAAQIAAVAADAALVTAIDEVGKAVRAAVGVAGALHAARLRTPPRAESSGSVAGLLHDFAVTEAALKGSENSNQVARQGLAAWEKAQEARQRIRELSKHVREVFVAARYAERELKMEAFAERRGEKGRREAAFALDRLFEAVERAIACSKRAADGSSAFEDPRE